MVMPDACVPLNVLEWQGLHTIFALTLSRSHSKKEKSVAVKNSEMMATTKEASEHIVI
jgi:hypothetical protein